MTDVAARRGGSVPCGLVLLVGAPGSGKSSLARAWVENGQLDLNGVVSCDSVRTELFGSRRREQGSGLVDRLAGGRAKASATPAFSDFNQIRHPAVIHGGHLVIHPAIG